MTLWAAFDPGESTGLAVGNEKGLQGYVVTPLREFENSLLDWKKNWGEFPATAVVEDFRLDHSKEPQQSKVKTVMVMGMIQFWCKANDIKYIEQARMYRPIGYKYWGRKPLPKSNPANHAYDAVAHLYYFMVQNKKWRVKL